MGKPIPVNLTPSHEIAVDGGFMARALDLDVATFRQLMDERKITVLCERGIGEDAGLYRVTFYYEHKRVRMVIDCEGRIIDEVQE